MALEDHDWSRHKGEPGCRKRCESCGAGMLKRRLLGTCLRGELGGTQRPGGPDSGPVPTGSCFSSWEGYCTLKAKNRAFAFSWFSKDWMAFVSLLFHRRNPHRQDCRQGTRAQFHLQHVGQLKCWGPLALLQHRHACDNPGGKAMGSQSCGVSTFMKRTRVHIPHLQKEV